MTGSPLNDRQHRKDVDAAYKILRREMDAVVREFRVEQDLRQAMVIYNKGAAQAQAHFQAALREAKEANVRRARGEDSW